jgi:putative aldouronate transport system substrate-binding protein
MAVLYDIESRDAYKYNRFYGVPGELMTDYMSVLNTLATETFTNIIVGNLDIDAFDDFVDRWRRSGGDEVTREVNEWYANR